MLELSRFKSRLLYHSHLLVRRVPASSRRLNSLALATLSLTNLPYILESSIGHCLLLHLHRVLFLAVHRLPHSMCKMSAVHLSTISNPKYSIILQQSTSNHRHLPDHLCMGKASATITHSHLCVPHSHLTCHQLSLTQHNPNMIRYSFIPHLPLLSLLVLLLLLTVFIILVNQSLLMRKLTSINQQVAFTLPSLPIHMKIFTHSVVQPYHHSGHRHCLNKNGQHSQSIQFNLPLFILNYIKQLHLPQYCLVHRVLSSQKILLHHRESSIHLSISYQKKNLFHLLSRLPFQQFMQFQVCHQHLELLPSQKRF